MDEARENGGEGPDDAEAREEDARGDALHHDCPWGLEDDVGCVEDGDRGREFLGCGADVLGHAGDADVADVCAVEEAG